MGEGTRGLVAVGEIASFPEADEDKSASSPEAIVLYIVCIYIVHVHIIYTSSVFHCLLIHTAIQVTPVP